VTDDGSHQVSTGKAVDVELLLINKADTRKYRPKAAIKISNLFLAYDYVITNTDLARWEAAKEAGRRAVNHNLGTDAYAGPWVEIWDFGEPLVFKPFKEWQVMKENDLTWNKATWV